jgi:hypothetical protein
LEKPEFIYHGSQDKFNILLPHTARGNPNLSGAECGIYAYEHKERCIPFTFAIYPLNGHISSSISTTDDNYTSILTISEGILDEDHIGYIYKISSETFEKIDKLQWLSKVPVTPIEIIEIYTKNHINCVTFTGAAKEYLMRRL